MFELYVSSVCKVAILSENIIYFRFSLTNAKKVAADSAVNMLVVEDNVIANTSILLSVVIYTPNSTICYFFELSV